MRRMKNKKKELGLVPSHVWVDFAESLLTNTQGLLIQLLCFLVLGLLEEDPCKVVPVLCYRWMFLAEGQLENIESPFIERLGLLILSLCGIKIRQRLKQVRNI